MAQTKRDGLATCVGCGCDDTHACVDHLKGGTTCHWMRVDREAGTGVCSFCPSHVAAWDAAARDKRATPQERRTP